MRSRWSCGVLFCAHFVCVAQADPQGAALAQRAYEQLYCQDTSISARVEMSTVNEDGQVRGRVFSHARVQREANLFCPQRHFIYFHEPRDVARMSFLVWREPDQEDRRWLFIPAVGAVRRIAARDARSSFAGSCLCYEDITGRCVAKDEFIVLSQSDERIVLQAQPLDIDAVDFDSYLMTIDTASGLPVLNEYYADGKVVRRFEIIEVEMVDERPTPIRSVMTDLRAGRHTELIYRDVEYGVVLDWSQFTEQILRNPPASLIAW